MIKANFDYELELFSGQSNLKINQEFDYLYWWSEDLLKPLSSNTVFDQSYLDYVQTFTSNLVEVTKNKASINWWGELSDLKNEKILNSKITSTQFAIENNLCHSKTQIISDVNEIKNINNGSYVLKNPYLMSGKGFYKFHGDHLTNEGLIWANKQLASSPLIFEPWLDKKEDFSSYIFFKEQTIETYFNSSNQQGNYKGTLVYSNPSRVFEKLEECGVNLDYYFQFIERVKSFYYQLGARNGMSIDSFTFEDSGVIKTYLLSEVNYRKTMGWVALKLKKFLPADGIGQFVILKRSKNYQSFEAYKQSLAKYLYTKESREGILLLSPHQNQFLTFFIVAKTDDQLNYLNHFLDNL